MRPTLRAFWLILAAVPIAVLLIAISPGSSRLSLYYLVAVVVLLLLEWRACRPASQVGVRVEEPSNIYIGEEAPLDIFVGTHDGSSLHNFEFAVETNDLIEQTAQAP